MSIGNPIQFAVVREDPAAELRVIADGRRRALLVASGGCTALVIANRHPDVALTLLDLNAAQLDLVDRKVAALAAHGPGSAERARAFGLHEDDARSLCGCGNFESLFRGLRAVLDDLVLPAADRRRLLEEGGSPAPLIEAKYWPVAFSLFFSDAMLEAMFTSSATQHAPRGSYPGYFQRVIERGLRRSDAGSNPWLHHVLLGHYLEGALPEWASARAPPAFERVHAPMADAPSFARFDVISLSNLFDWMDEDAIAPIVTRLRAECAPGTAVIVRQLNNRAPVERALGPAFALDVALSDALTAGDRSLFYERVMVFVRGGAA